MGGLAILLIIVFALCPILIAILLAWGTAAVCTGLGIFLKGHAAYVSATHLTTAPWLGAPGPFPCGWPAFGAAAIVQTPAVSVASIADSIGDYFSCARLAGAPVPDRLFTTMPQPIAGGLCCAMFGMVAAVSLLNLHVVDHTSMKILFILTFVLFIARPSPSI